MGVYRKRPTPIPSVNTIIPKSANYAGYLAGSLLFSFGLFHLPSRLRPMLLASAVATGILILS
ncbi:MFS transporter, partial [Salmonella enterica subsp. enterica serovar Anatum]|nr:MFS transporter [Salmonella enterica subsp. enterica serovar Anatum]